MDTAKNLARVASRIAVLRIKEAPLIAERDRLIMDMHREGATLEAIAKAAGVSRGRVWQTVQRDTPT
jgi:DNA-directed RNA polymerase sigma subunit (sigma70/sigma32)